MFGPRRRRSCQDCTATVVGETLHDAGNAEYTSVAPTPAGNDASVRFCRAAASSSVVLRHDHRQERIEHQVYGGHDRRDFDPPVSEG